MIKYSLQFRKNGINKIYIFLTILILFLLVSSSSVSVTLNSIPKSNNIDYNSIDAKKDLITKSSNGLAPNVATNDRKIKNVSSEFGEIMRGYVANSPIFDEGTCYFDTDDPGAIVYLDDTESDDFLSGGTGVNGKWIACENSTGVLWEIDPDNGDMTFIGGGCVGLNGLAHNPNSNRLYGASGNDLYEIDEDDGVQEYIGSFGNAVDEMIGIAFNGDGVLYGWDLGDKFWTIDEETGEAYEVGPLGVDLNYAQDGGFCWEEDILYLTAWICSPVNGSYLCAVDTETGECTIGDQLEGNSQITASVVSLGHVCCEHDVGVSKIIGPVDGNAGEDMEVIIRAKNFGKQSEYDVPVKAVILKNGVDEEYNETVYVDIEWGDIVNVEMPAWTPDDWQNISDEYLEYKIIAYTSLKYDNDPSNDLKVKWIELYFGYFHDVGGIEIIGPESGLAQTFPVNSTIMNYGQFEECCFKTYVEIAEQDIETEEEELEQDFSESEFPPIGWTTSHEDWMYSETNWAGGSIGEARLYYQPTSHDIFRLNSPPINTSDYDLIELDFKHFLDHSGCVYKLEVGVSQDGENWSSVWETYAIGDIGPENITIFTLENLGPTTYFSWALNGSCLYVNNWYLDDIVIKGYKTLEPEYEDYTCISQIESGEEVDLEFDQWTPEFLAEEQSDIKIYLCQSWTDMIEPLDENPTNDLISTLIELEYSHNVGIKEIWGNEIMSNNIGSAFEFNSPPYPDIYIAPGSQEINSTVQNIGTFPEFDLNCSAEIYEYITNYSQGTLVYEDFILDIDLEEPLGGLHFLGFNDYNFADEGVYGLYLDFPLEIDDYKENNQGELIIGVDDTPPIVDVIIDPPEPDGDNGWYVNPPNITIIAYDPEIAPGIPGSGVAYMRYSISGEPWQTINSDYHKFSINQNGEIYIEFFACDNVGNCASISSITIHIDMVKPEIEEVQWEAYKEMGKWYILFTCTATDSTSGMNRVEMFIDDGWFMTETHGGPTYEFITEWQPIFKDVMFDFIHYDFAGNSALDDIDGSNIESYSYSQNMINQLIQNPLLLYNNFTGPSYGIPGIEYTFCIEFTDPEADDIFFIWDWGDGTITDWLGPYGSGETVCASHIWSEEGLYLIRVKGKDIYGNESDWVTHEILIEAKAPHLEINRPKRAIYLYNRWVSPFIVPVIIGDIQLWFCAEDKESGLSHIELFIDDELRVIFEVCPKSWNWDEPLFFKHEIKLIAYDKAGNNIIKTKNVWKFY